MDKSSLYDFFETNVSVYVDAVYRFAISLTNHDSLASELTDETFLQAFEETKNGVLGEEIKLELFRITLSLYTKNSAYSKIQLHTESPKLASPVKVSDIDDFSDLMDNDVMTAINGLPSKERVVLLLLDSEGMSYDSVADLLKTSRDETISFINNARNLLFQKLIELSRSKTTPDLKLA